MTHDELLQQVGDWSDHHGLHGKVSFVVDHGTTKSGYWDPTRNMSIVFAGPSIKADDVLAASVGLFSTCVVVTADNELKKRCRRASNDSLHIMNPLKFILDLEQVANSKKKDISEEEADGSSPEDPNEQSQEELSTDQQVELGLLDAEIRLGAQLLEAQARLRSARNKNITNKRRKKLEKRVQMLRERLAVKGPSVVDRVTNLLGSPETSSSSSSAEGDGEGSIQERQDILLSRWEYIRKVSPRKEQTGDRVILAERLRRSLIDSGQVTTNVGEATDHTPAKTHVQYMNGYISPSSIREAMIQAGNAKKGVNLGGLPQQDADAATESFMNTPTARALFQSSSKESGPLKVLDSLKIVAVSDTHGFEDQFEDNLPEGDVLLHLGDFALDGLHQTVQDGLRNFDHWLSKQDFQYKIVIRGNHDPWNYDFEQSGAWYVTRPTSIVVEGVSLALIPYGSARMLAASGGIPTECDVLATHVPPHKELDKCLNGRHAGSAFLNRVVYGMSSDRPPRVWFCGHIHEGRGMTRKRFGKGRDTIIINASNANPGRASHISHGPVLVKVDTKEDTCDVLSMEDREMMIQDAEMSFFEDSDFSDQGVGQLLLAVDLGLRSGVSMYNSQGQLLRYEQFHFDRETLPQVARDIVEDWEFECNDSSDKANEATRKPFRITHIAIEGGDPVFREAWAETRGDVSVLSVPPEEWRAGLLTKKERKSGKDAKAAARLIARQVVSEFGTMDLHDGKFKTDVAESVVLGMYVARKLGWISTQGPVVRRYSNGNIVVPPKAQPAPTR